MTGIKKNEAKIKLENIYTKYVQRVSDIKKKRDLFIEGKLSTEDLKKDLMEHNVYECDIARQINDLQNKYNLSSTDIVNIFTNINS
jgi:hypothetical protein